MNYLYSHLFEGVCLWLYDSLIESACAKLHYCSYHCLVMSGCLLCDVMIVGVLNSFCFFIYASMVFVIKPKIEAPKHRNKMQT